MKDTRVANKRVVLLGLFLAFVLTECIIYMERSVANDIFAYFLMITHPVALFVIYEDIKVEIPDNRFLAAEKKAFGDLLSGLFEGILGALSIGLVFLPIALALVYVFDFFGMTVGNSLMGNLLLIALAILVPSFFLLGYFAAVRGAFIAMALRSPSKVANNYVDMPEHQVCPKCGCVFSSPVYVCTCGERYPDPKGNPELVPSSQGTDFIECTNPGCRRMLPVTDQGGRDKLYKVCPDCSAPVAMFPGPSFLVTLAGPSGSGKTTLAFGALHSVEANSVARYPNPFGFPLLTPEAPIPPYVICFGHRSDDERCLALYEDRKSVV